LPTTWTSFCRKFTSQTDRRSEPQLELWLVSNTISSVSVINTPQDVERMVGRLGAAIYLPVSVGQWLTGFDGLSLVVAREFNSDGFSADALLP
jgi:hypothetical protein